MAEKKKLFLFCFYQIRQNGHLNFHHVLIPLELIEDDRALRRLDGDGYVYYLMSQVPVLLTSSEMKSEINRPLIMDGESLWKRLKKNFKTQNKHQANESNRSEHASQGY